MSLALSLCQCVLRPRCCPAQVWPSLEAPRLVWKHATSCINILEGKGCRKQDKKVQEAGLEVRFCTWNWYDFGRRSEALHCSRLLWIDVSLCEVNVFYIWTAEESCMGGLKTGRSWRHGIQAAEGPVLDLRAKETRIKRWTGLKSKSFLEGPVFIPFWLLCVFWFLGLKRIPSLSYCFAPISIALRLSKPASKPALTCSNFHCLATLEFTIALRPACNFVSSYTFLGLLQFP